MQIDQGGNCIATYMVGEHLYSTASMSKKSETSSVTEDIELLTGPNRVSNAPKRRRSLSKSDNGKRHYVDEFFNNYGF